MTPLTIGSGTRRQFEGLAPVLRAALETASFGHHGDAAEISDILEVYRRTAYAPLQVFYAGDEADLGPYSLNGYVGRTPSGPDGYMLTDHRSSKKGHPIDTSRIVRIVELGHKTELYCHPLYGMLNGQTDKRSTPSCQA
jgi:hypothetical protein